ncbi:MAG: tRNA (cytidine(34)-2'-O)-methyltransferase [Defluviitaleaceae bacterium]|nr:tRNA (cytidine(34)-2'-O)-methyltransferase [Defluviitaleaceae bacterium]
MNIVLYQPEIPHNTGAIGRTCLVTASTLHLIRPYGFFLDEKSLKRSGLDYWHKLDVREYDSFEMFAKNNPRGERFFFVETTGGRSYTDVKYEPNDYFIFGSETTGISQAILDSYPEQIVRIPMKSGERSLNLSVAVGIVLFEGLRQVGFIPLSAQ